MVKLLLLFTAVFLLIFWLVYRETRHRKKNKAWAKEHVKKNNIPYQTAINSLKKNGLPKQNKAPTHPVTNSLNSEPPEALQSFQLIRPGMISEETFAIASEMIDAIKRPHPALQAITRNISTNELIDILHGCPDITAKVLTTVNSSAFGLIQPITSINHAVIHLGLSIVKSIATQFIIKQSMVAQNQIQKIAYQKLWSTAYLTSSLTFLMAQSLSKINAAELSTKALLSSIGCFAITSHDPDFASLYIEESSLFNRTIAEQSEYDLNAGIIGNLLAKKWKLPQTMIDSITHTYFPLKYNKQTQAFTIEEKHDLVFCYLICRLSELISHKKIDAIEEFELSEQTELSFFYLQEALEDTQLTNSLEIMKNPTFVKKANAIIKQSLTK